MIDHSPMACTGQGDLRIENNVDAPHTKRLPVSHAAPADGQR